MFTKHWYGFKHLLVVVVVPEVCPRCALCPRCAPGVPQVCPRLCPRCAPGVPQVCIGRLPSYSVICRCTPGAHLGHNLGHTWGTSRAHLGHKAHLGHTSGTTTWGTPRAHLGHISGTSRAKPPGAHLGHTSGTPRAHLGHTSGTCDL